MALTPMFESPRTFPFVLIAPRRSGSFFQKGRSDFMLPVVSLSPSPSFQRCMALPEISSPFDRLHTVARRT